MIRRGFFVLSLCLLTAGPARAAGENFADIPRQLLSQGIRRIGAFDVQKFIEQGRTIEWTVFDSEKPPRFAEGRKSAHFIVASRKVFMSNLVLTADRQTLASLELHEALGALGYNDRYYNMSSSLNLIAKMAGELQAGTVRTMERTVFKRENIVVETAGSGSSVGGGGDVIALTAKNMILSELLAAGARLNEDFLASFPHVGFETFSRPDQQMVALRYMYRGPGGPRLNNVPVSPRGDQEFFTIYLPALKWAKGGAVRRDVVREAAGLILQMFPIKVNAGYVFPQARDAMTGLVQQTRSRILSGREISSSIEVRTPSFTDYEDRTTTRKDMTEDEVRRERTYVCQMRVGNLKYDQFIDVERGEAGQLLRSTMIGESRYFFVRPFWNAAGDIVRMDLMISEPDRSRTTVSKTFKPGEYLFASRDIGGGFTGSYGCTERKK